MAAGDFDQARAAVAESERQMPRHSLEALKATHPFTHPEHLERYLAALQAARWGDWAAPDPAPSSSENGGAMTIGTEGT
jgi:hypothetical protein